MREYFYIWLMSKAHHSLPFHLALVAEIAETPPETARAHQENFEESEKKS